LLLTRLQRGKQKVDRHAIQPPDRLRDSESHCHQTLAVNQRRARKQGS